MRTITKSAPLAQVGSSPWLAQQKHQLMTEMTSKSCLDWSSPSHRVQPKKKDELAASRIYRTNVTLNSLRSPSSPYQPLSSLQRNSWKPSKTCTLSLTNRLDPIDATVQGQNSPVPKTFFLHTMWMFGCTKPTRELTAVAQTSPCRYHLGLGIYNVQTAVEGMEGNKRSQFLHLCGQLLRLVLIPCHVEGELHPWTRSTALILCR